MIFFEKTGNSLLFRANDETVMITPWGTDSLRVRSRILEEISDEPFALLDQEQAGEVQISPDGADASVTNGRICARLHAQPGSYALQIRFFNQQDELLLEEIPAEGVLQMPARCFTPLSGSSYRLKASFLSNPDEKIYGMGQYQQETMDLKGCNLELAQRNSQASVPFYLSSLGYGFLWNNPAVGEVHFGLNTTEWIANSTRQLDYWITAGDTPAEIEEHYSAATGRVPMMPEYGLGFWQSKLRYYSQEQVLSIASAYKERNIPLDVLVIDFYHWPRCGDWRFDEDYFPDPAGMIRQLHDMGIETMVSVWPTVEEQSENYEEMKQLGLLVKTNSGIRVQKLFHGNCNFMDATNPRTRRYVWEKCKKNYADLGVKTFWLDEAEPDYSVHDFSNYRYYSGPVEETGNIYPREYARLFYEGQKQNGQEDIVNLIRCAWAGSQRYGALVWSGDIKSSYVDFRRQICAGIHMGLSGIPWWTTDIGGFHSGDPSDENFRELLVRWFQFGTFCPVMRLHGTRLPDQPIYKDGGDWQGTGADNEVWSFGEQAYPILVKFIHIREMMRDYTRSLMVQAHETGAPVLRALFFEFPEDPVCWDIKDSYMFGPDILVAPICHEHAVSRQVYLPAGASWTHAGTGRIYQGGQSYEAEAPLDTLPIFLREGRQDYLIGQI